MNELFSGNELNSRLPDFNQMHLLFARYNVRCLLAYCHCEHSIVIGMQNGIINSVLTNQIQIEQLIVRLLLIMVLIYMVIMH